MADHSMSVTYTFSPNTIIASAQMNTNLQTDIRDTYNGSLNVATGHAHDGTPGNGPKLTGGSLDLTADYPWTGVHSWEAGEAQIGGAGAGKAALEYANSANDRTLTIPDPGANADFVMTGGAQTISGTKTFNNASVAIDLGTTGNRIDLDADNDTSIRCLSDDVIAFEAGGSDRIRINTSGIDLVSNGNRIDLDADNDTSIRCSSDDTIKIEVGGSDKITINSDGEMLLPDVDPPTFGGYINRNSGVNVHGQLSSTGVVQPNSYNIDAVASGKVGVGKYHVIFDTNLSSSNFTCVVSTDVGAALNDQVAATGLVNTNVTEVYTADNGIKTDMYFNVVIFGRG
jgi:hypothetical protein